MTEKGFERLLNAYSEKFGENYPLQIPQQKPEEEIIEDIIRCIETDTPAEQPVYDMDLDY